VFTYHAGRLVPLVARAGTGYRVVRWTGNTHTIANVNGATTFITVEGDYVVTANFPVNWPLMGGIIGAVVVAAGLAVFVVLRRRATAGKRKARGKAARKKR
jgi:hypothetical protein